MLILFSSYPWTEFQKRTFSLFHLQLCWINAVVCPLIHIPFLFDFCQYMCVNAHRKCRISIIHYQKQQNQCDLYRSRCIFKMLTSFHIFNAIQSIGKNCPFLHDLLYISTFIFSCSHCFILVPICYI